jgi:hypothetical protein
MAPAAYVNFHPFAATLKQWETGVPVDCGMPWAWSTIEAAVEKGAHKSVTSAESIALIAEDVAYQVKAGYAQVITWTELCKLRPRKFEGFPTGCGSSEEPKGTDDTRPFICHVPW